MTNDATLSAVLRQLDGVANAPMTAEQRETRAAPVLRAARVAPADAMRALSREDLPWNEEKAREYHIPVETWMRALEVAKNGIEESVGGLLDCIHRAESAATMLRAGYLPKQDDSGKLIWSR